MAVSFNSIPTDLAVPLFYAEVDNSRANTASNLLRSILIGHANDDAAPNDQLTLLTRESDAAALGGSGSMLDAMYETRRRSDPTGEVWGLAVQIEGAEASGEINIDGTATASGVLTLYIAGRRIAARVIRGETAQQVAATLAGVINGANGLPVRAEIAGRTVKITCRWRGETGNDIALMAGPCPGGLSASVIAMSGGAGVPDVPKVLASIGDAEGEFIAQPWTDSSALDDFGEWMGSSAGRWSWSSQLYGHIYSACRGQLGSLVSTGRARNDEHVSIMGVEPSIPQPTWEAAAAFAARQSVFLSIDPARPTQTGLLGGINPPPVGQRFTLPERQILLNSGIATSVYTDGSARIERAITTYQRNPYGQRDDSYLDSETLHTTSYSIRYLRSIITSKYGRHKLANDGTRFGAGQAIVTPSMIRAELIAGYAALERRGLVENAKLFARYLIVNRDESNANRLNILFPADYVNQLRIFAVLMQFRLQYPEAA